jgi:putative membrane protein
MARFKCSFFSMVVLSAALVHCSKRESSESRAETPGPAATTEASGTMTPASRTMAPDETRRSGPATGTAGPESMGAAGESLSDEQIVELVDLANTAEVEEGRFAQTKAKHSKVKSFAAKMVMHHGQAKQKGDKLATKLALTPAESSLSGKMKSESESSLTQLKDTPVKDLDRAYIAAQIKEHEKVLSMLDDRLIPAVKGAELRSLLQEMRSTVQSHLSEAQQIETDLQGALQTP